MFVHIDKAAGSNIQRTLEPHLQTSGRGKLRRALPLLGCVNRNCGLYRIAEFSEHSTADEVRRCLPPEVYAGLFKFAFVRNPWDRLVSRHAYLLRTNSHAHSREVKSLGGFEAYLRWELARAGRGGSMRHQADYVLDAAGNLIVDAVGYFERLQDDFTEICRRIGIRAKLGTPETRTPRRDYRSFYSDETRELVAGAYARDIAVFGYTFEGMGPDSTRGLLADRPQGILSSRFNRPRQG